MNAAAECKSTHSRGLELREAIEQSFWHGHQAAAVEVPGREIVLTTQDETAANVKQAPSYTSVGRSTYGRPRVNKIPIEASRSRRCMTLSNADYEFA